MENAIEIGRVRTPEDGRPYNIYDDAAVRFSCLHGRFVNRPYYLVTSKTLCPSVARGIPDAPRCKTEYKALSVTAYYRL